MKIGYAISDLHLFTRRSSADYYLDQIRESIKQSDLLVLNGDIFDFKWSQLADIKTTIDAAINWLEELLTTNQSTEFVLVIGNHDSHPLFFKELDLLAKRQIKFSWEPYFFKLNDKVFTHGDIIQIIKSKVTLETMRARYQIKKPKGKVHNFLYSTFIASRAHVIISGLIPRSLCAQQLIEFLNNELGSEFATVKEIFFGHVHTAFSDFKYQGLIFHNTGAAISGLTLIPLRFEF